MQILSIIALAIATCVSTVRAIQAVTANQQQYVVPGQPLAITVTNIINTGGNVVCTVPWSATNTGIYTAVVAVGQTTGVITVYSPTNFSASVAATFSTTVANDTAPTAFTIYAETITSNNPTNGAILIGGTTAQFVVTASNTGTTIPLVSPSFTVQYGSTTASALTFSRAGTGPYTYTGSFSVPQNFLGTLSVIFTDGGSPAYIFIYTYQVEQATVTPTLPIVTTVTASALPCAVPYCGNPCSGPCRPSCNRPCNRSSRRSNCRLYGDDASISNFDAEITQPFAA